MKKRLFKYFVVLFVVLFFMSACGDGDDSGQRTKQPAKKTTKKSKTTPVKPEDQVSQEPAKYVYNPSGKRDPFENPLRSIKEVAPDSGVPLTPLQKFDLSQLRLIGVIIGKGEPRGMVIAPGGKSFILTKGTKVGKNDGTVVGITTEAVLVEEKYYDFTGQVKTSVQQIPLPKQGGVK